MRIKYLHKRPLSPHVKTVFLSREQSRSWAMMEPIGNPNCDTYNDPISAALSISAMAGTYAAAGSFAAMTFAQGMIFAGSAINLAGNVTGNSSLQKIGAGVALVGGVSAAYDAFNSEVFSAPVEGSSGSVLPSEGSVPGNLAQQSTIGNQVSGQQFADTALTNRVQTAALQGVPTGAQDFGPYIDNFSTDGLIKGGMGGKASGFVDYINKHPGVAMVGASTIGPALGSVADYASGKTQAEMDALKADAEYKRAVAKAKEEELALQEMQRQRLNDPNRYSNRIVSQARQINTNPGGSVEV